MALSEKTIEICKATAPVLVEREEAITEKMYEILFTGYPDTKVQFGEALEEQYKMLAGAIVAYAANIDNLKTLGSTVENIAKKHVQTNVKPQYYPIVDISLLKAIKDVLGDIATGDVIGAWKETFFFLGDILIAREKELYKQYVA